MMDYDKLVEALRCKRDDCEGCDLAFFDNDEGWMCQYAAKDDDAADAIEALRKRLVSALTALHLANEKMGYYGIQPYTEADGDDMISDWVKTLVHEELEQQLPKCGEWVYADPFVDTVQCSLCGGQLPSEELETPYCPYCGAKMEAQDDKV